MSAAVDLPEPKVRLAPVGPGHKHHGAAVLPAVLPREQKAAEQGWCG